MSADTGYRFHCRCKPRLLPLMIFDVVDPCHVRWVERALRDARIVHRTYATGVHAWAVTHEVRRKIECQRAFWRRLSRRAARGTPRSRPH